MDGPAFDRIARALATARSRRGALGGVLGGAFAALAAALAGGDAEARRAEPCFGQRCGRGKRCCDGFTCCDGRCTRTRDDSSNCGACGVECDAAASCRRGVCRCALSRCGTACCDFDETCLDEAASQCGACPVGAGIEDPDAILGCGPSFGGFSDCVCVTSVDGVAVCGFGFGYCVDCESDDQCTLAMNTQALCIPVGDICQRYDAARACVEADCFGSGVGQPARSRAAAPKIALAGAGPYMRLVPDGKRRGR